VWEPPQPHNLQPMRGAHRPKREALCGQAGREDRDVRHQDRKYEYRARVSREGAGKAGWRRIGESAVTGASFYVRENGGPLVEGSWLGTSVASVRGSVVDHNESVSNLQDRHRRLHDA